MSLTALARPHFDQIQARALGAERAFRETAWRNSEATGLPTRKTETWKYISLAAIESAQWNFNSVNLELPSAWSSWLSQIKKDFSVAVMINGVLRVDLSSLPKEIAVKGADFTDFQFRGEDGFSNLTAAVAAPGYRLEVAAGVKVQKPLVILNYLEGEKNWSSCFHQIRVQTGAELRLIEVWAGGASHYFRSELMEAMVEERATLSWIRHQCEGTEAVHFNETQVHLAAQADFHLTQIQRGARWSRGQMQVTLNGEQARATVHGLTFGDGEQQVDQRLVMRHLKGETESQQLFKGVFKARAKGSLNGKIYIARDAQKVNSLQMNHNLLLSAGAEANTKPELEIYADDVKANHGATVGRLDEEKMFYLQSRGLTSAIAEKLLSEAFAADIYMKIPVQGARALVEVAHG